MMNRLCEMTGADFPLFAFSHCRDVVVAVSRAGGFGVLGGSGFTPGSLKVELDWIADHVGGKPFGVDILIPENLPLSNGDGADRSAFPIPDRHLDFLKDLLARHGVSYVEKDLIDTSPPRVMPEVSKQLLNVAFQYPIRLIANALGTAPREMIELGRRHGVPVAALVGAKEHAVKQVAAGVDILVAQGGEAGGHCGEVSTLVLVPEVLKAISPIRNVPVLAAGGIMTGRQMAGCMALGAQGAWTGSVWLATQEAETSEAFREKMIAASSRDTIRSRCRTGKPARQLRSTWFDAWEGVDSPGPLPMPLMSMISRPAFERIELAARNDVPGARDLVSYFVGQGVGLVDAVLPARAVVEAVQGRLRVCCDRAGERAPCMKPVDIGIALEIWPAISPCLPGTGIFEKIRMALWTICQAVLLDYTAR